jgi:hypothetical protein
MNRYNKITPNEKIDINNTSNICIVSDHMPMIENSISNIKNIHGYNTIDEILNKFMPHVDTVVFDHYNELVLDKDYKIFYLEKFFDRTLINYNRLRKNNSIDNSIDFLYKTKKFNYLSNKPRESRFLSSAWIANNYNNFEDFNYTQTYEYNDFKVWIDEFILAESLLLESRSLPKRWIEVDSTVEKQTSFGKITHLPNELNFYKKIKLEILPTVFSIVIEPVFWEHGCILTEKYINAVLGGSIPIVNGYKVYDVIKEMGLDTFDDIIDTSAQYEKNAIYRILNLLEKNKNQIDNALEIIKDKSIQKRIENNIKILENYDYNLARSRYSDIDIKFLISVLE